MSGAEWVEPEATAIPELLSVDYRCAVCGSPFIESDGWVYCNLPLNESEGLGHYFCDGCEVSDGGTDWETRDKPANDPARVAQVLDWVAYRAENGLVPLEETDEAFLRRLGEQIKRVRKMAGDLEAELWRLTGPHASGGGL